MRSTALALVAAMVAAPSIAEAEGAQVLRFFDAAYEIDCSAESSSACGGTGRGAASGAFDAGLEISASNALSQPRANGLLRMRARYRLASPQRLVRFTTTLRIAKASVLFEPAGPDLESRDDAGSVNVSIRVRHRCACIDPEDSDVAIQLVSEETSPARGVRVITVAVVRDGPRPLPPGFLTIEISIELAAALPAARPLDALAIPLSGRTSVTASGRVALSVTAQPASARW